MHKKQQELFLALENVEKLVKIMLKKKFIYGLAYTAVVLMLPHTITTAWQRNLGDKRDDNSGRTVIINENGAAREITLNEYLTGVVAGQIDAAYAEEAVKAQTILTRSFVCNVMEEKLTANEEDLRLEYYTKKELEKKWGDNFKEYYEKISSAVEESSGQIMSYDDCVAEGVFHELSAGATRDGTEVYPYLVSVKSDYDIQAENYMTIKEYSFDEFMTVAAGLEEGAVFSEGEAVSLQIVETDAAGYVKAAMIGTKTFEGERIMEIFKLPSCAFTFQILENKVRIICHGRGYGYGMSQYGASKMAEEGSNAEHILKYYFQGVEIGIWE